MTGSKRDVMTRRRAIHLLHTEETIRALDLPSYLLFQQLAIELSCKDLNAKIAHVTPPGPRWQEAVHV